MAFAEGLFLVCLGFVVAVLLFAIVAGVLEFLIGE